jgi:hypothetical protein
VKFVCYNQSNFEENTVQTTVNENPDQPPQRGRRDLNWQPEKDLVFASSSVEVCRLFSIQVAANIDEGQQI